MIAATCTCGRVFDFDGSHYQITGMQLEPRPTSGLTVYQGGQSPAALQMAGQHADWMFLNGGRPEKLAQLISKARAEAASHDRRLRFAVYAAPICADTDSQAWAEIDARLARLDRGLEQRRQAKVGGAVGMLNVPIEGDGVEYFVEAWGRLPGEDEPRVVGCTVARLEADTLTAVLALSPLRSSGPACPGLR